MSFKLNQQHGGGAFPCENDESKQYNWIDNGMSLRDYFAGQALAGGLEQGARDEMDFKWWHSEKDIAERAYDIAGAMLKERKARGL